MIDTPITFAAPSYAIFDTEAKAVRTTEWGNLAIFSTRAVAEQWAAKSGSNLKVIAVSIAPAATTSRTDKMAQDGYEDDVREKRDDHSHYMATAARALAFARQLECELNAYKKTAPICQEHLGGARGNCLVCGLIKLSAALSRINYLCGEPNEMRVSNYDVYFDEDSVVKYVESRTSELAAVQGLLLEGLEHLERYNHVTATKIRLKIDAARKGKT